MKIEFNATFNNILIICLDTFFFAYVIGVLTEQAIVPHK